MVLYNVRSQEERGIPQGGLEIPRRLLFEGSKKYVDMESKKLKKLRITKDKQTTSNDQEKAKAEPEAISKLVDIPVSHKRPSVLNFFILKRLKAMAVGKMQEYQ